jgi:hypothetical protein
MDEAEFRGAVLGNLGRITHMLPNPVAIGLNDRARAELEVAGHLLGSHRLLQESGDAGRFSPRKVRVLWRVRLPSPAASRRPAGAIPEASVETSPTRGKCSAPSGAMRRP